MVAMQRVELAGEITFRAQGAFLSGRLVRPRGRARAAVVLHGATGVPAGYYGAFAEWLARERDLAVLTYDYRDFGASARGPLSQARATMIDWGLRDQAAALEVLGDLVPGCPRWVIGHSLGGLWLGFHPAMAGVERVVTVGSGLVHVSDHPAGLRLGARVFWHGPVPALSRRLGYVPGSWLGFGADLPLGVYEDWRRWCLTPGFYLSDLGRRLPAPDTRLVRAEMRVVAVSDDAWVPPAAVWRMMALHPEAEKRQLVLRPGDFGLDRIGHLGAFHRRNSVVWPALVD
jgi:predicted alpha/beta hydrolase